jgi:predicted TIM-barrel fold metal-dependent hydrolase
MIIDCDTHFMPPDAFDYVDQAYCGVRPKLEFSADGLLIDVDFPGAPAAVAGTTPLPAPGSGANLNGLCDIEVRLRDYEKLGIEQQFLVPQFSGWWSYLIEPKLAADLARSYNLSVLKLMRQYPDVIIGVALVALQDVESACAELDWATANGFKAVVLDKVYPVTQHPYGESLGSRRELWPFFRKAEALAIPLYLHNVQHGHRISNLLNFQKDGLRVFAPQEGQMSLVSLITSGLLDEFPGLQFIFTEAGTAFIKPLVQRLDKLLDGRLIDYDGEADGSGGLVRDKLREARAFLPAETFLEKNRNPASYYFRNNFYFTIETEEPELPEAVEFLGAERFLFATDYPHDDPGGRMKYKDVQLLEINTRIAESAKELIRHKNAERLFFSAAD